MFTRQEIKRGQVLMVGTLLLAILVMVMYANRAPSNRRVSQLTLPTVSVVAKITLEMETSVNRHMLNDVLYALPDRNFAQRHHMVRLVSKDELGIPHSGARAEWFDVDQKFYDVIHVDSTYHLSMMDDSTGYLLYHRAQYPVHLVRSSY